MSPSNRRHQLRNHTANSPAALDETVGPLDSLAGYRRYLRGVAAAEAAFAAARSAFAELDAGARDVTVRG